MNDESKTAARLWQLLEESIALGPEQRREFLDSLENDDPSTASRLRELLQKESTREGFLATSVPAMMAQPPETLGPYRLQEKIGEGGSGAVYRAVRIEGQPSYPVAIKILRSSWDERAAERFAAERELLGSLDHPGICRMLTAGETPSGLPWFAMELIEGQPIDQYCRDLGLSLRQRLEIYRRVLTAIEYSHSRQLVHLDLKPNNVLVDRHGTPKVVDFGISDRIGRRKAEAGPIECTPAYASPEQLAGDAVGPPSDIFSLGVLLHTLAETDGSQRAAAGPFFKDLDAIQARAMAKRPRDRYLSVSRLAEDLERLLGSSPIRARQSTWFERARLFTTRHRTATAASALTILALATVTWQAVRIADQRDVAAAERVRAQTSNRLLIESLADLDPSTRPLTELSALDLVDRAHQRLEHLEIEDTARADLLKSLGSLYGGLGTYTEALEALQEALRLYSEGAPRERAETLELLAVTRVRTAEYDAAESIAREALQLRTSNGPSDERLGALSTLAWTIFRNSKNQESRLREAELLATEAHSLAIDTSAPAVDVARLERLLSSIFRHLGETERALDLAVNALQRLDPQLTAPTYERAMAINQVALLEQDTGQFQAATANFRAAHEILSPLLGEHAEVAGVLSNIGTSLAASDRFDQAATVLRDALQMYDRLLGPDHPMSLNCASSAAHALQWSGDLRAAEELHSRVAAGLEEALGSDHVFIPLARAFVAENLVLQSRLDRAVEVIDTAAISKSRLEGSWMALSFDSIEAFVRGSIDRSPEFESELESTSSHLADEYGPNVRSSRDAKRRLMLYRGGYVLPLTS